MFLCNAPSSIEKYTSLANCCAAFQSSYSSRHCFEWKYANGAYGNTKSHRTVGRYFSAVKLFTSTPPTIKHTIGKNIHMSFTPQINTCLSISFLKNLLKFSNSACTCCSVSISIFNLSLSFFRIFQHTKSILSIIFLSVTWWSFFNQALITTVAFVHERTSVTFAYFWQIVTVYRNCVL